MTETIDQFVTDWTQAERNGDAGSLESLLSDDFLGVGPLGFVLPKDAWLGRFAGGLAYESFELEEIQTRLHGDAAVITARQMGRGTLAGSRLPFEAVRATLSLVRKDQHWQMAGAHLSFIAGTPGAPPLPTVAGRPPSSQAEPGRPAQGRSDKEQHVSIEVNHLIIPATDKQASARFLADILGLDLAPPASHFQPLQVGPVTLDYDDASDIRPMHIAFLVDDITFDAAHHRLLHAHVPTYADPRRQQAGQINHRFGGRGLYFDDADGHLFELMTAAGSPATQAQLPPSH